MNFDSKKYLHNQYITKFFKLDNTEIEKLWTWKFQSIIDNGFNTWKGMFYEVTARIPQVLIPWIYIMIQIYLASWIVVLCAFIVILLVVFLIMNYFNTHAVNTRKIRHQLKAEANRHLIKMIMSKMEIVQNQKEKWELAYANNIVTQQTTVNIQVARYLRFLVWTGKIFSFLLQIFTLFYGIVLIEKGGDLWLFVGLVICIGLFTSQLDIFTVFYKDFTDKFIDIQKLRDTFDEIPLMKNKYSDVLFQYKKGEIWIHHLGFSYSKGNPVFDDFSLTIEGGKKTAFVGLSGSGKSTLIKLIAWYLSADQGEILVDGQNIQEINMYNYFSHIGYLTQEPSVFDGTIYENLVYALKEKPEESELKKVIASAKCEFIYDFPDGLQTEIGEKGIRLSWGQRQRLAIAKIMLKNPDIILLDEPTSALDSFNEEEISQALNHLFKGKTVIIIAHRLQTVKNADQILLFESGKVVETGTHEELIKLNGKYKKMLDLQSGF